MNNPRRSANFIKLGLVDKGDLQRSADDLMNLAERDLRNQPDELHKQLIKYHNFCADLCRTLYKARRG